MVPVISNILQNRSIVVVSIVLVLSFVLITLGSAGLISQQNSAPDMTPVESPIQITLGATRIGEFYNIICEISNIDDASDHLYLKNVNFSINGVQQTRSSGSILFVNGTEINYESSNSYPLNYGDKLQTKLILPLANCNQDATTLHFSITSYCEPFGSECTHYKDFVLQ